MKSIDDLKKKVEELNLKAHDGIDPRFYVFDEFVPKQIPEDANDEIRFWYLIINLYGLFHDCGKYITSIHYNNKDGVMAICAV